MWWTSRKCVIIGEIQIFLIFYFFFKLAMSPTDISEIFLKKRANSGDKVAKDYLHGNLIERLSLEIESLGMSMQMQFSRIQGSSLHQINTKEVGNQLKSIIETGINKLITTYIQDVKFYQPHLQITQLENLKDLTDQALLVYERIKNMNLSYDFQQIVWQIKDLKYIDVIRILKVLIITSIFRRSERRKFFPT
ncbi:hypothetical protein WKT22_01534 [Candidatus Lokiarchaeum ossiferum]